MESSAVFSQVVAAIENRIGLVFVMVGVSINLTPYVLYDGLGGRLMLAGMTLHGAPLHVPVAQIADVLLTDPFYPDPVFNLDDPRYRNAHAIIERI